MAPIRSRFRFQTQVSVCAPTTCDEGSQGEIAAETTLPDLHQEVGKINGPGAFSPMMLPASMTHHAGIGLFRQYLPDWMMAKLAAVVTVSTNRTLVPALAPDSRAAALNDGATRQTRGRWSEFGIQCGQECPTRPKS